MTEAPLLLHALACMKCQRCCRSMTAEHWPLLLLRPQLPRATDGASLMLCRQPAALQRHAEAGASSAPSIAAEEAAAPACVTTAGHAAEREASAGPEAGPAAGEQAEEEEEGEGGEEPRSEPGSAPRPAKKKRRKGTSGSQACWHYQILVQRQSCAGGFLCYKQP